MGDKNYLPHYNHTTELWKVDFQDRDTEEGDPLYVASEFAKTSLYFPYNTSSTINKEFSGHAHSFEGVIHALLGDPQGFTIRGFEDYYSQQEREFLEAVSQQLHAMADTDQRAERHDD